MTTPSTPAELTDAEKLAAAQAEEYGRYVATQPIDIGGARAFNPGHPVPASHVERYGLHELVRDVRADDQPRPAVSGEPGDDEPRLALSGEPGDDEGPHLALSGEPGELTADTGSTDHPDVAIQQ